MNDLISRQTAIDALKNDMASLDHIIKGMSAYDVRLDAYVSQRNQVNCDIDTINNLPPVQPELGTNLAEVGTREVRGYPIDADALMEKVAEEYGERARNRLYQIIRYMPPAQHEQRIGKWIRNGWAITCSECGYDMPYTVRNFCPNCGAKMTKGVAE